VIVAAGLFGVAACDLLMRSGCNNLRIVEWDGDGYVEASVGGMAAKIIRLDTRSVDEVSTVLAGWLPVADLVVTATRSGSAQFFHAVNRLCLEHRRPWLRGNFDGSTFEIGPYVYPYGSACYSCLELRRASAMEGAIEEQIYQERLAETRPANTQPPLGEALFAATLGASVLTAEVIRTVTNVAQPTLLDHVSQISAVVGTMETSHVLRVPRCPDCYRGEVIYQSSH
jgi:bacteriocin biosynthesis cyclodehydratase domain-containing protein